MVAEIEELRPELSGMPFLELPSVPAAPIILQGLADLSSPFLFWAFM